MFHQDNQSGMTLVELLVAVAMMILIMSAVFILFREHNFLAVKQEESTRMQQDLLSILTLMTEDLRMCGYDPNKIGGLGFNSTNATSLTCTKDNNGDGTWDSTDRNETAAYRFVGTKETMEWYDAKDGGWVAISDSIADAQFSYFDKNGAATATPADVRVVEISITAMPAEAHRGMHITNRSMTTHVTSRNLNE